MKDIEQKRRVKNLTVQTTEGKTRLIGQGADRPAFVVFFSLTCSSCLVAAPKISKVLAPYLEGIHLIGIGRDHEAADLEAWQAEQGTQYQLVPDPARSLFEQFAKLHVPRFYLIDTQGKVRYQDVNWHPLMLPEIERVVQEQLQ